MQTRRLILTGLFALVLILASAGSAPLAAQSTPDPQPGQIDQAGALVLTWKRSTMWIGDYNGPTDGNGRYWHHPQFSDSTWSVSAMPNSGSDGGLSDYYYRAHFTWDGTSPVAIHFVGDDGLQVYVNGNKLGEWGSGWRLPGCFNVPSCLINYTVPDQIVPTYMLQTGDNVIAIDLWNSLAGTFSLDVGVTNDVTPPSNVIDLHSVPGQNVGYVKLQWTAPGNNGTGGGPTGQYDIRYGTTLITEANWSGAQQVNGEPAPAASGTLETWTLPNSLAKGTRWHFAMKTRDPSGNWSALSNVPSFQEIGFRPPYEGYNFPNSPLSWGWYPLPPALWDFTESDLRKMFGDYAVCQNFTLTSKPDVFCSVFPAARDWLVARNRAINGGHCDGYTVTSLRFLTNQDSLSTFQNGATSAYDLSMGKVRQHIAYYQVLANPNPVARTRRQALEKTPSQILDQLSNAMLIGGENLINLLIYKSDWTSGHSVTPYALEERGDGVWRVWVYDSNAPGDVGRYVAINTANNDFWASNLVGAVGSWTGNATTHNLAAVPISVYAQAPECPWCNQAQSVTSSSVTSSTQQIWYSGSGHILVTNSQGQRIGYLGSQFIGEIPGAFGSVAPGGLGVIEEPVYYLPVTDTYSILLDGGLLTSTASVALTQFGPGYAVSVDNATITPLSHSVLTITQDGTGLAYHTDAGTLDTTFALALNGPIQSYDLQVKGIVIENGQIVTVTADTTTGRLKYSRALAGTGNYQLSITRVDATADQWFVHSDLVISATDTQYVNYGAWDGTGPITLEIDRNSDGTIDGPPVVLENQVRHVYLPLIARN